MRSDMYKVIVERPRLIHGNWLRGGREDGFRQYIASEDVPSKVGMRAGHRNRKWPNENLAPLRRFLMSNAGRPWNKVRSELLAGIDQRNTVQQHILTHVDDYVLTRVRVTPRLRANGKACGVVFEWPGRWGHRGWEPVEQSHAPLFVDPRTGLLRLTNAQHKRAEARRDTQAAKSTEAAKSVRELDAARQLRCEEDIWFEVELAPMPGPQLARYQRQRLKSDDVARLPKVWDVWERRLVSLNDAERYAIHKRQLNSTEIARYHLRE